MKLAINCSLNVTYSKIDSEVSCLRGRCAAVEVYGDSETEGGDSEKAPKLR
jgi:hypothetical protein